MCGIAGFFNLTDKQSRAPMHDVACSMAAAIAYRGPDAMDAWCDERAGIALAHRRLSIIDLSPAGAQPMTSSCGRMVLSYNGEIYNADEIRRDLVAAGISFRGHSDTEVLVEACAKWGVKKSIQRMIGMFAFALWDKQQHSLILARDRLGIKPLYWKQQAGLFLFGSELKALLAHPDWASTIDRDALTAYLRFGYVPAPRSIYCDVRKLEPGTILEVSIDGTVHIEPYWSLDDVVTRGRHQPFTGSPGEATNHLDTLLSDAVKRRMVADVPLGALLSGGIDSSTIVALMQAQSATPVKSFSIGFHEQGYNEANHAKAVAAHLGTDHTELYVSADDALSVIPKLPQMYDEPFADSSQIPTYLVSEMTRQHVTVALSGDGGDELFGGYNRYRHGAMLQPVYKYMPRFLRSLGASAIEALSPDCWDTLSRYAPSRFRHSQTGDKAHKFAGVLRVEDEDAFYRSLVSQWHDPASLVQGGKEFKSTMWDANIRNLVPDFIDRMQYLDTRTYLPDDILTKVDRASMAVSLEVRVPILDHRVVEFAWTLPQRFKANGSSNKWLLREVLHRYVPRHIMARPKMGFGVPINSWLRTGLRDWAESLLEPGQMQQEGYLNPEPIHRLWKEHLSGARNRHYALWPVLMFQAWLRTQTR